jgi:O-antigen/teichoic acid export membrane protein
MRSRILWRRLATAGGVYSATALGFFSTVVVTRELGTHDFALFATVVAATSFVSLVLDLTIEEALVKFGFRYSTAEDWGRFRRLFEVALAFKLTGGALGAAAIAAVAPFAASIWDRPLTLPLLVAAAIPLVQAPENIAASAMILRGRYDVRGAFLALSMALRLAGVAAGASVSVLGAIAGMVAAQVIATAAISVVGLAAFRRFPQAASRSFGEDRRDLRNFVISSTLGSTLVSARDTLGTALMGAVAPSIVQAGYFNNAKAPATGFAALSAPVRLVLLTEQTYDFERGRLDRMYGMLRRYVVWTTLLMLVVAPLAWWLMPWLMGIPFGEDFRVHATTPARLVLIGGSLQLIFGWAKSFPISIGRPNLRLLAHGAEVLVFVPLLVVLGSRWGATGGAAAFVCSTCAFCAVWTVLLWRIRRAAPASLDPARREALAR